ncbi:MAG: hypothetical protein AABZ60_19350 [Planctomycetota bacterium]
MFVTVTCSCGKSLKAPIAAAGKKAKCPRCGSIFVVPSSQATAPASASKKASPTSLSAQPPPRPEEKAAGLPKTTDGRPPKCSVCEYRTEEIQYSKKATLFCETCSFYFASYENMLHLIQNPEAPPDPKISVKLKLLLESRYEGNKGEAGKKKCYFCSQQMICFHYYRVPTLVIEVCPKGCGVLVAISNFKRMQALEKMNLKWAGEIPFPKIP